MQLSQPLKWKWLAIPMLLMMMMSVYPSDAQEHRSPALRASNDLPIRKGQVEQELAKARTIEQEMVATWDRAQRHRHDANGDMFKAQLANLVGIYKKAGKVTCEVSEAFGWGVAEAWGTVCNGLIEATELVVSGVNCSEGKTEECEAFHLKALKKTGQSGKWGELEDSVELTRTWQKFKASPKDSNATKELLRNWCDQSAKWITKVTNRGGNEQAIERFIKKQQAVCAAMDTTYEISEDLQALSTMAEERQALDRKILSALKSMENSLARVRAKRMALEQQVAALPVTLSDRDPCNGGPMVNPELARADESANNPCKPKLVKKDTICDETLGCPDDETSTKGPGKDLLAKLDSHLGRIQHSQPGTAGGALPGESQEAGSTFDKTAMLRSLRSGLGAYNQGREAFSSSGGLSGGGSGGQCPNRVPVPQELRTIAQRRGVSVPLDPTIDEMIAQAGSAEAASSGLRQHIQELRQALAQWPRGSQEEIRRQMELEVGYEQSVLQAVDCKRGARQTQAGPETQSGRSAGQGCPLVCGNVVCSYQCR